MQVLVSWAELSLAWAGHWDTRGRSGPVMQAEHPRRRSLQPRYSTHLPRPPRKKVNSEQESREKHSPWKQVIRGQFMAWLNLLVIEL